MGIPALGAGAIYPIDEREIICDPMEFPAYYRHVFGLDVGWQRTAALWLAIDPETDVAYAYSEHYRGQAEPAVHAAAIRSRGAWIPGVIDPASRGRTQNDGQQLLSLYTELGLNLVTANNAVEAGLYEVWQRLSTGRLKVFRTLQNFLTEYRIYRRDEKGRVIKEGDHLMDCLRYICMSGITLAAQRPYEEWDMRPGVPQFRKRGGLEAEYDPYAQAYAVTLRGKGERAVSWPGIGGWDR